MALGETVGVFIIRDDASVDEASVQRLVCCPKLSDRQRSAVKGLQRYLKAKADPQVGSLSGRWSSALSVCV